MKKDTSRRLARLNFARGVPVPKWQILKLMEMLPADANLMGVIDDQTCMVSCLFFSSEKFAEVKEGSVIPTIGVQVDGVNKTVDMAFPDNPEGFMDALDDL